MIPVKKKNLVDNKGKASRDEKEISIIMKKRYALLLTGLLTLSLAAGCGAKTDNAGETSAPAVSESQAAESTEQTADVQNTADQGEEKTITGTIDEIKDFMFVITDESGAAYEFSFETAPEGLENVAGGDLSPQDFFKKYVNWDLSEYISTINAPTKDKPFHKVFSVEYLGNVEGGRQVRHLNLPVDEMKDLIIKQLKNGEVVWFGSNVVKDSERQAGLLDTELYKRDDLFDVNFDMSKADMLDSGESMMDHAMVITGVDLVDGKPTKWKIENSWGEKPGFKGYFVMSDKWFDKFVYQAVINKKYLSDDLKRAFDEGSKAPIQLLPWDPMGALAKNY